MIRATSLQVLDFLTSHTTNIWRFLRLLAVALCVATVAGLGARSGWVFDLATGFRLQYFILLALLCVLFLLGRKGGMMLLTAAFALANLWPVAGYYIPEQRPDGASASVAVLFATVGPTPTSADSIATMMRRSRAGIVAICGLDGNGIRRIRALMPEYRHVVAQPRKDPFGVAIFSRLPISAGRIETIGRSKTPVAIARCALASGEMTFVVARALPARGASTWNERNAQLADLGTLVSGEKGEIVLLGALELTPWSPFFDDLLARGRLEDGRKGEGLKPTWPVWMGAAGVPLDHVLHTGGVVVEQIGTPRIALANRLPVVVTLRRRM